MKNTSSSIEITKQQSMYQNDRISIANTYLANANELDVNDQIFLRDQSINKNCSTNSSSKRCDYNRVNRGTVSDNSSSLSSNGIASTTQKRKHKKAPIMYKGLNAVDEQLKTNCDNIKTGLPGNQLVSSKLRRTPNVSDGMKFCASELLSVSKAFVIDVFQMQFNNTDFVSYMTYVKINVTNDDQTPGRIEIFTTNDFTNIIQQDSFIGKMNRFITDERHRWLNYWNSVLMDRKSSVLQASMDNIKFEVATTVPMLGMIGDTGIGNRIFSIERGYVFVF